MPGTWVGEGPGGRRCRARRRRHSILADPACDSEVVGEGAPVVARKRSLAVRETILIVVRPGVPAADDDGRAIMSGDVLCRRRVIVKERQMRRVHELILGEQSSWTVFDVSLPALTPARPPSLSLSPSRLPPSLPPSIPPSRLTGAPPRHVSGAR